jgi:hypothetical protein
MENTIWFIPAWGIIPIPGLVNELTVSELENHHFFNGKITISYGKIIIFFWKITMFQGKITYF